MRLRAAAFAVLVSGATPSVASRGSAEAARPPKSDPAPAARRTLELLVLHATNARRGIDARLKDLPELSQPPFSSYDSYALVDRSELVLDKGVPKTRRLPNGRVLEARLLAAEDARSVRLSASINQPGGADFLPLLEVRAQVGQRFIVAGQRYKSGILVLVLRVVK